jgi:hypothetical protein
MYKYSGFGLHIASEIECPELLPAVFEQPDVTICIGKTPEHINTEDNAHIPFSSINKNEYLLDIKNICKYYAANGNILIAEPADGTDERSIRLFALGVVMAAILYQRMLIPLHASAIIKDGKLVLFTGNSGAGKSTLIAHLITQGYRIFTDDICIINVDNDSKELTGVASYPMIKLWDDAIAQLDNEMFTLDFKVRPKLPKFGQFFYDSFDSGAYPIDKIFVLNPVENATEITVCKMMHAQSFKLLDRQTYKNHLITNSALRAHHFAVLLQLAQTTPVFEITRPATGAPVSAIYQAIHDLI